ncbi:MAG: DUF4007 family protein [Desulfobacteraceae bacterium]
MSRLEREGHRNRLRARFLRRDPNAQSDDLLLELLLTYAIPRKDVQPMAQALLERFGSLERVLSASKEEITKIDGIGDISWILLKLIDNIRGRGLAAKSGQTADIQASERIPDDQLSLFESTALPRNVDKKPPSIDDQAQQEPPQSLPDRDPRPALDEESAEASTLKPVSGAHQKNQAKASKRKLQVSNGHLLEFDQLARLLYAVRDHHKDTRINFTFMEEETGMPLRQVRNRVSIGRAMGLFHQNAIRLSNLGELVVSHDTFMEAKATLEFLHFMAAGNRTNLIWYEVFNTLLVKEAAMDYEGWVAYFRKELSGLYSAYSLRDHLSKEIRFVVDAYLQKNFRRLEILQESPDGKLFRPRYAQIEPIALCAMIYDYGAKQGLQLMQVEELSQSPGSPALVFGVDAETLRQKIETLHEQEWLRYETTHNLNQIRLKPGLSALEFLAAHYENRQPMANAT